MTSAAKTKVNRGAGVCCVPRAADERFPAWPVGRPHMMTSRSDTVDPPLRPPRCARGAENTNLEISFQAETGRPRPRLDVAPRSPADECDSEVTAECGPSPPWLLQDHGPAAG